MYKWRKMIMNIYLPCIDKRLLFNNAEETIPYFHDIWDDNYKNPYEDFSAGKLTLADGILYYDHQYYLKDWPMTFIADGHLDLDDVNMVNLCVYYDIELNKICARLRGAIRGTTVIYKIESEQLEGFIPKYLFAQRLLYGRWFIKKKYKSLIYTPWYIKNADTSQAFIVQDNFLFIGEEGAVIDDLQNKLEDYKVVLNKYYFFIEQIGNKYAVLVNGSSEMLVYILKYLQIPFPLYFSPGTIDISVSIKDDRLYSLLNADGLDDDFINGYDEYKSFIYGNMYNLIQFPTYESANKFITKIKSVMTLKELNGV